MLEKRVTALEERLGRIETILTDLAPKITEIQLTGAKQADVNGIRLELAEMKGKVSTLPTTWQMYSAMIGAVATASLAVSGLIFTILRFSKP